VNLVEVLRKPEGKTLEYKRDLSSPDGLLKTLVAFANTAGGILAIGIEDRTTRVTGVPDVLEQSRTSLIITARLSWPTIADASSGSSPVGP